MSKNVIPSLSSNQSPDQNTNNHPKNNKLIIKQTIITHTLINRDDTNHTYRQLKQICGLIRDVTSHVIIHKYQIACQIDSLLFSAFIDYDYTHIMFISYSYRCLMTMEILIILCMLKMIKNSNGSMLMLVLRNYLQARPMI